VRWERRKIKMGQFKIKKKKLVIVCKNSYRHAFPPSGKKLYKA
jgi:hypothetical protein